MWKVALCLVVLAGCDDIFHLRRLPDVSDAPGVPDAPADAGNSGPLAFYDFATLGPVLRDVTNHGHDGACMSGECPTNTAGPPGRGNAGYFDGTDQVTIQTFGMPTFTVSFWLRIDTANTEMCPVNRLYGVDSGDSWQVCAIEANGAVTLSLYTTLMPTLLQAPPQPMVIGSWHHVAIRSDGETKSIFYDRGEVISAAGQTQFDTGPILLGQDVDAGIPVSPLIGALDDVSIYGRALTNEDILTVP